MSTLLVTTLIGTLAVQTPLMAVAQTVIDDPLVIAQNYIDQEQTTVSFKKLKSLQSTIVYLLKQNPVGSNVVLYGNVNLENVALELPFYSTTNTSATETQNAFVTAKNNLLDNIIKAKKENYTQPISVGETDITITELTSKLKNLETAVDIAKNNNKLAITKVNFTVNKTNSLYNQTTNKLDLKKIEKTKDTSTDKDQDKDILAEDIATTDTQKPTERQKQDILKQAQETKEGIARKAREAIIGETQKLEKDKKVKEFKKQQKLKKLEIAKKLKTQNKSNYKLLGNGITTEDIYALGDDAKELGLSLTIPKTEAEKLLPIVDTQTIPTINITKIEQESTDATKIARDNLLLDLMENVGSNIGSTFAKVTGFDSITASAFYPEQQNVQIYHSTPTYHQGTGIALMGASNYNGNQFVTYTSNTGWNQLLYMNSDDTIRVGGRCLDLKNGNKSNRSVIQLWDCNGGNNQKWVYDTEGRIRLKADTNWCIDNDYGNVNALVYLNGCGSYTETFRAGEYEMRIYSRRGN